MARSAPTRTRISSIRKPEAWHLMSHTFDPSGDPSDWHGKDTDADLRNRGAVRLDKAEEPAE